MDYLNEILKDRDKGCVGQGPSNKEVAQMEIHTVQEEGLLTKLWALPSG